MADKVRKEPHSKNAVARQPDGKLLAGSGSLNPGGVPKWRRDFAEAFGEKCAPKAERVLTRVLNRALNTSAMEKALEQAIAEQDPKTANAIEERLADRFRQATQAADVALKYVLPKPQQVVKVEGLEVAAPLAGLTTAQILALAKQKPPEDA